MFLTSVELDVVYARWSGVVDAPSMQRNFGQYLSDPNYRPGRPELIDLSGIERLEVDFETMGTLLMTVNSQIPGGSVSTRTVVWAPHDEAFGTARMYQQLATMSDGIHVEVFREEDAALRSLRMPHARIEDLLEKGNFVRSGEG